MLMTTRGPDESVMQLDAEAIAEYHDRGFTCVGQIATPEELELLRTVFDRLFAERAGRNEGAYYDMLGHDSDESPPSSPEIIGPINYAPELRQLRCRHRATAIARQLLGPHVAGPSEHAILKPAHTGGATPWHQDEAYSVDPQFSSEHISFWIPLQDVTLENGCMMFMPGSHKLGVLPHGSPGNDSRIHALECVGEFDQTAAVACPLPAGFATVHHGHTLHFAGPNRSARPRIAYILEFDLPPKRVAETRDFYWNRGKQAARSKRRRQWQLRGGIVIQMMRKLRSGTWYRPGRLLYEVRRAVHVVWAWVIRS
jgi:ectoine hydroxylase-related dioxygenase (phytanoyl-CoA dioxygenase family)